MIQQICTLKIVRKSVVSVNESTARLVHESTALPQEICILFTEHLFSLRTYVTIECLL